jgi:hypothetical protein
MTGNSETSRFKGIHPIMVYVFRKDLAEIKAYAKQHKISLSQLAREALKIRMSTESDQYINGLNDGLDLGMDEIRKSNWAQMTFPSGKTFAELICEELERKKHGLRSTGKGKRSTQKAERDPEGSDPSLAEAS